MKKHTDTLSKWQDMLIEVEVGAGKPLLGRCVGVLFGAAKYARFRDHPAPQIVAVLNDGGLASFPLSWCELLGEIE